MGQNIVWCPKGSNAVKLEPEDHLDLCYCFILKEGLKWNLNQRTIGPESLT